MIRRLLTILAAASLLGAARAPAPVAYRLDVEQADPAQPPTLLVEIRLRGDADGETRLDLPDSYGDGKEYWRNLWDLQVKGATVAEDGPAVRILRHKPGAPLVVRYRVRTAYPEVPQSHDRNPYRGPIIRPAWMSLLGNGVFATPADRENDPATFRWGKLPHGWRAVSDLEHGAMGRPMTVHDVGESITMGGQGLRVATRAIPGGSLRVAMPAASPMPLDALADDLAGVIAAQRSFWNDLNAPYLVAQVPLAAPDGHISMGGTGRGDDAFVLYAYPKATVAALKSMIAHEHMHSWIPMRTALLPDGAQEPRDYWFSEGFTDFYMTRTLARGGLWSAQRALDEWNATLAAYDTSPVRTAPASQIVAGFWTRREVEKLPYQRGALLALKWDEEIRRKTQGRVDLDDVVLRMRDRYISYAEGKGPDAPTGLVSAAWDVAGLDLRPAIARYAEGGAVVDRPDELFGGCVLVRTTVSPAFDAGFDLQGSIAAKVVKGVRRGGPGWNSGLRDGMAIKTMNAFPGDTSRQVELTVMVPPAKGKRPPVERKIAYWPYGQADTMKRKLELKPGLSGDALAACGKAIGGT
jgi:predicted metalloprotease with PDZ domain